MMTATSECAQYNILFSIFGVLAVFLKFQQSQTQRCVMCGSQVEQQLAATHNVDLDGASLEGGGAEADAGAKDDAYAAFVRKQKEVCVRPEPNPTPNPEPEPEPEPAPFMCRSEGCAPIDRSISVGPRLPFEAPCRTEGRHHAVWNRCVESFLL